jgi:hypothetical protein
LLWNPAVFLPPPQKRVVDLRFSGSYAEGNFGTISGEGEIIFTTAKTIFFQTINEKYVNTFIEKDENIK